MVLDLIPKGVEVVMVKLYNKAHYQVPTGSYKPHDRVQTKQNNTTQIYGEFR